MEYLMIRTICVVALSSLSACATLVSGSDQTLTVSTTPPGASCTLDRIGARIGAISATPGSLRVDKSKNDLSVTCTKDGFQTATVTQTSHFNGATFGNILAGGVIGIVVDAASGANYNYPGDIRLDLAAVPAPVLAPLAMAPAPEVEVMPITVRTVGRRALQPQSRTSLPAL